VNGGPADLVLAGARVFRLDRSGPDDGGAADAVAVRDGRIVAVGREREVGGWIGPETRVVRFAGGLVVPGFQDAHIHPDGGGLVMSRCSLHDLPGPKAYVEAVRSYAKARPDVPWILGGGWSLAHFPRGTPHRSLLDDVVPDRPVYLPNRDGHGAWVNTKALEIAALTRDTPDPRDGRIERDEDGTPSGTLHEGAMQLVSRCIPAPSQEELEAALLTAQSHLHSLGITAWQDAHVSPATLAAYLALAERGALTARVTGALWWDRHRGEEQVKEFVEQRATGSAGRFRATAVKIMQDGIPENFTAALLSPYLDTEGRPTTNRGLSFVEPTELNRYVAALDREGFQVHIHAIGDRAVGEALDAFEVALRANGRTDGRHHIAHLQLVHPDDVPRFAKLGVAANAQPFWACLDRQMRDLCLPFLGQERTGWQYPFAGILEAGGRLAMGSDWPVTTPDPLKEIEVAVTRMPHGSEQDQEDEPFLPHERLRLDQAVDAFTRGSAYVNHLDETTGSIDVGKLADLAVIDSDLFSLPPREIGEARVVLTLVEGEPVYADVSRIKGDVLSEDRS
jgi:predicted amidohydrolase YtcJ